MVQVVSTLQKMANLAYYRQDVEAVCALHDMLIDEGHDQLAKYLHHCISHCKSKGLGCNVVTQLAQGESPENVAAYCKNWRHPT